MTNDWLNWLMPLGSIVAMAIDNRELKPFTKI